MKKQKNIFQIKEKDKASEEDLNEMQISNLAHTLQNKTDRQNPRRNGKSKAVQTKSLKEAYTYTLTKREKGKKYCCSQSPSPQFWDDLLSIQVFHRCRVHQGDCGDLIR